MFTGIVQGQGQIEAIEARPGFRSLVIQLPPQLCQEVAIGASIAVNGTCLTVTGQAGSAISFDVIEQTLALTNLGGLKAGDRVNIERSLRLGDELGGHILSGHIATTVKVLEVFKAGDNTEVVMERPASHGHYILPQGFIGLNGCSLTVAKVTEASFSVCLIPETLRITGFSAVQAGDAINLEIDHQTQTIVATVERVLAQRG